MAEKPEKITYKPRDRIFTLDELISALTAASKTMPGTATVQTFNSFRGVKEVTVVAPKLVEPDRTDTD